MQNLKLEASKIGLVIGLSLAILILVFGFWNSVLVILFGGIGWFIGWIIQNWNISFEKIKQIFTES
ncbi:DUF2273 domain-containing protein [Weissella koreensis]|uniref:DUF2273 domain-containing protein n=1 Tax=Weissella koreensis TaxID=165096 RepID=UPI002F41E2E2